MTADVAGGVWDHCRTLAAELVRGGDRVTVLVLGEPGPHHRAAAAAAGAACEHLPVRLEWMSGASEGELHDIGAAVRERVVAVGADVLQANHYAAGVARPGVPVVLVAHSDVLSWHRWTRRADAAELVALRAMPYARTVEEALGAADAVVAVSAAAADDLRTSYGLAREVTTIHNGWPAGPPPAVSAGERGRVTLVGGRIWDEAKNLGAVAEAAAGWDPGKVLVAGETKHPDGGTASLRGLEALGFLAPERLEQELLRSRVYLAPARYEPFGLLALQAAVAGCALVLGDIPSFREVWDGVALFVRPDAPRELRQAWRQVLQDGELATERGAAARERALVRYGSAGMAAQYRQVYRSLGVGGAAEEVRAWHR
jgi:glycogen(starch) synthase